MNGSNCIHCFRKKKERERAREERLLASLHCLFLRVSFGIQLKDTRNLDEPSKEREKNHLHVEFHTTLSCYCKRMQSCVLFILKGEMSISRQQKIACRSILINNDVEVD